MKNAIITLLLLFGKYSVAQNKAAPNQFDSFIKNTSIEWAAYANTWIHTEKINFNKLLLDRYIKKEIKASPPRITGIYSANYIDYLTKDSLDKIVLNPLPNYFPVLDSNGNLATALPQLKPLDVDTSSCTNTGIAQIFYIESGKLESYILWATPSMVNTAMSPGESLGCGEYFSTAFNFKYNYAPAGEKDISFLVQTNNKIKLNSADIVRLKELYGRNLVETLWPYYLDNKIEIFTADTKRKLTFLEINDTILSKLNTVKDDGNYYYLQAKYGAHKYPNSYFDLNDFTEIQVIQDWYYSYTENIVFNKIKEIYLCAKKWTLKGEDKEPSRILKIVFNTNQ